MAFVAELKKTVSEATPVYAAVGVTDLAVEKVRDARTQAVAARRSLTAVDPRGLQHELGLQAERSIKQVQDAPAILLNRSLEIAGRAQEQYDALAVRGEELVKRIRDQRSTKELLAQVDQTVSASKGAVTTARRAVASTQQSAKATLTTGRREAAKTLDTIEKDVDASSAAVVESAKRTRTAGRRTATTARKGAASTTSRARATNTTATKAATRARKATKAGARKIGD